jgi:ankyrin repeat protein
MEEKESTVGFKRAIDRALANELAADSPSRERVLAFFDQGADVNAIDGLGESMLMCAIGYVAYTLDLCFIELLIESGADLNYRTPAENSTALHSAVFSYKPELMQLLLERGADPNVISDGESVLDLAEFDLWFEQTDQRMHRGRGPDCVKSLTEMISILEAHGAKTAAEIRAGTVSETL